MEILAWGLGMTRIELHAHINLNCTSWYIRATLARVLYAKVCTVHAHINLNCKSWYIRTTLARVLYAKVCTVQYQIYRIDILQIIVNM